MRMSRRTVLGASGAALVAPAPEFEARPAVELVDDGTTVTLANGLISLTVTKATAQIPQLRLVGSKYGNQDVNLFSGQNGQGYTTFDYYVGPTRYSRGLSGGVFRIVSQSADRVEIAMSSSDPAVLPFAVDVHLALERGMPGFYGYMVFGYPAGMPAGLTVQQLRYAFAAGDPAFTYFVVDDKRGVQQRPTIAEMAQAVTLQDTTYRLPDGRVYSKYQNISDLEGDNHAFLISNGKVGVSVVQANKDFFAGGPTKQELTCHDYYNGEILLWHPFTSHYGSPDLEPPVGWSKVYGPFYVHVNEDAAEDPAAAVGRMWTDTRRAAVREQGRWPYQWVAEPLYAAKDRRTVSGRTVAPEGTWVVLAPPGEDRVYQGIPLDGDDWQCQNLEYVYSGQTGRDGRFSIRGVRPGPYTLNIGDHRRPGIVVGRRDVALGLVAQPSTRPGEELFHIGRPDRSTAGFHVPGGNFRTTLTWLEYPYEFPDGVDFRVGIDDPAKVWNFFQPAYRTPGTPAQLALRGTTPDRSLTEWRVRFPARGYRHGTASLDIALAGSVFGTLRVTLNGTEVASLDPLPGPAGDNSSYRLAGRGIYRRLPAITFPATLIKAGVNVLAFSPVRAPKAPLTRAGTADDWMEPMAGVMYDSISLRVV
jgi:rhamnogalacturonan endolyase